MLCPNCDYNNKLAPSDAAPCAFCGYRGETAEAPASVITEAVATETVAPTPAIPAILEAVEAPAPPVEPIAL